MTTDGPVRCTVFVRGRVQGVGFRWWTRARALERGLAGWARNTADGRVEVVAEGERAAVEGLLALLGPDAGPTEAPDSPGAGDAPAGRPGRVTATSEPRWAAVRGERGFRER